MSTSVKTNYRCVESFNISVYVSKCVENVPSELIHYIHIGLLQKMTWIIEHSIHGKVPTH